MKKISAAILDFAKPLTDGLAADAPLDLRRDTLRIAITLWNALVLQACGQGELLTELFDRFRKMPHRDSVIMGSLVRDMVLRKHSLHAEDLRLVGEWELRDLGGGEVSLRAVAHAPLRQESDLNYTGRGEDLHSIAGSGRSIDSGQGEAAPSGRFRA